MVTLVDTNILLDIATVDPVWLEWSENALEEAAEISTLAVNPLILAEVSAHYETIEELDEAIPANTFSRVPLPFEAAFLAGKAFQKYRRNGGVRTAVLSDFYIGAHAAVAGFCILTRDTRRYKTYFPSVELIAP